MPRRYVRRKKKTYSRKRYPKRFKRKRIPMYRLPRALVPETKVYEATTASGALTTSWTYNELFNGINRGTTSTERIGNRIFVKRAEVRCHLSYSTAAAGGMAAIKLVKILHGFNPTGSGLFATPDPNSFMKLDALESVRGSVSRMIHLTPPNQQVAVNKYFRFVVKNFPLEWSASVGAGHPPEQWRHVLMTIAPNSNVSLGWHIRVWFTDA